MTSPSESLRARIVPALLTGLGSVFIAAGLLSYVDGDHVVGGNASGGPSAPASIAAPATERASPSQVPLPSVSPGATRPAATGTQSPSKTADTSGVATRVVVPALGIDLPIVKPPAGGDAYPYCNVAMYLPQLHQPGELGATYIFAHARTGMFLPLLDESKVNDGRQMIGMLVQVYTSGDRVYLYSISEVRRHVTSFDAAFAEKRESLWLQTSEGYHIPQKLQVVALPISSGAASHPEAHPTPHPVVCE